jgi:hypothetical protein
MAAKPTTIDEYLAALSDDKLAAFRQDGMLVAFGATANHCAFYVMSSSTLEAHKDEIKDYDVSKGTITLSSGQAPAGCPGAEAGKGAARGKRGSTPKIKIARSTAVAAKRLSLSEDAACRWVGKDALRELTSPEIALAASSQSPVSPRGDTLQGRLRARQPQAPDAEAVARRLPNSLRRAR